MVDVLKKVKNKKTTFPTFRYRKSAPPPPTKIKHAGICPNECVFIAVFAACKIFFTNLKKFFLQAVSGGKSAGNAKKRGGRHESAALPLTERFTL